MEWITERVLASDWQLGVIFAPTAEGIRKNFVWKFPHTEGYDTSNCFSTSAMNLFSSLNGPFFDNTSLRACFDPP